MAINKQIPEERWVEFFDIFTNGNKGRSIDLEIIDPQLGNEKVVEKMPLLSLVYDPVDKGNNLAIEIGREQVAYGHNVQAPNEVWQEQDDNGKAIALGIKAENGSQTIVRLF